MRRLEGWATGLMVRDGAEGCLLTTMRSRPCMAGNSKFALAERPEPRYTPKIAF